MVQSDEVKKQTDCFSLQSVFEVNEILRTAQSFIYKSTPSMSNE